MRRRFVTLDVFTDQPFAGNPLAVVLDAEGLAADRMQAVAREFNLSETVFVLPPADSRHRARLRIFTPARELPFAGHPTVGTAVLLGLRDEDSTGLRAFGLEEEVGIVSCAVERRSDRVGTARFRVPRLPEPWGEGLEPARAAWGLGLDPTEIGFDRHRPSRHSAGVPYDLVPVASLEALARAQPSPESFQAVFGASSHPSVYAYAREGHGFRARMFFTAPSLIEDPATGSAAASFAGTLMQYEPLGDGEHDVRIRQGVEMGRPSEIALQVVIRHGELASAEIGGSAVVVSEGEIEA
ncbi:MAG: PhzF family phenazine biosynthesis protein [Methylobacteriaceae bacterium]|nr:PhzF family phenazine biosynthesis protein [Methylobacteriaceae bacterium]